MITMRMYMPRLLLESAALGGGHLRDGDEARGLQAGAAYEDTVDVRPLGERLGIVGLDAAPIEDADALGELPRSQFRDQPPQVAVDFTGLTRRRGEACADCPDGLVGEAAPADRLRAQSRPPRAELPFDHGERQPLPTLVGRLSDAEQRPEAVTQRRSQPFVDLVVRLVEEMPPLGVADEDEAAP